MVSRAHEPLGRRLDRWSTSFAAAWHRHDATFPLLGCDDPPSCGELIHPEVDAVHPVSLVTCDLLLRSSPTGAYRPMSFSTHYHSTLSKN